MTEPKKFAGYSYAVISVDRAEGNAEVGTQWQDTYLIPIRMPFLDAFKFMFGENRDGWPKGRVTVTVPEFLPPADAPPTPTDVDR